jgi:uroporphyrinogen III methyltransferase/synthase
MSDGRKRPLAGKCVVVTRPENRARPLAQALTEMGARVVLAPAIRFEPPRDPRPLDDALARLAAYDFVVFTSATAVDAFFDRVETAPPPRRLPPIRFVAVGPKTAESLRRRGYHSDVVPERYTAEGLGEALLAVEEVRGKRFLLPRADIAREVLIDLLESLGASVDAVVAYRTVPATEEIRHAVELVKAGQVDVVTFTSGSTARSFLEALPDRELSRRFVAASIGPATSFALRELGVEPTVEAAISTTEGLVDAIARYLEET